MELTPRGSSQATRGSRMPRHRPGRRVPAQWLAVATGVVLACLLTACGDSGQDDEAGPAVADGASGSEGVAPADTDKGSTDGEVSGDITVFAAASLTDTFTELGEKFEAVHPGVSVTFNFSGSSALAQQILSGAPADVFASASQATMALVTDGGQADGEPVVFVNNRLQIAVPAGNPGDVTGLEDLTDEDLTIALCAQEVPCGTASATVFEAAGLTPAPDTYEEDVRATLTKVRLDEVDVALVYQTDVLAAGDEVEGIDFPESAEAVNDYPIAALLEAPNAEGGRAFVDFVLSDEGQQVLGAAGFGSP